METQINLDVLADAEKQEAKQLRREIIEMTNRVPPEILNQSSADAARTFKKTASAARKTAESRMSDLPKLRDAYAKVSVYYRTKPV